MNHRTNKGSHSQANNSVINAINPKILNRIPTVATVFFCSFLVWKSSAIFIRNRNKILFVDNLVLMMKKSSKNSVF